MSDYNISPEAHDAYRSVIMTTPFQPRIVRSDVDKWRITLNQAYILNYLNNNDLNDPIAIGAMDQEYIVEKDKNYIFEVAVTVDTETGAVSYADLLFREDTVFTDTVGDQSLLIGDDDGQVEFVQYIAVAKFKGSTPTELYLRDNIHWWGRKIIQYQAANTDTAHVVVNTGTATANQPLDFRSVSGNGLDGYRIVSAFDSGDKIVISGVTGFGVMYGDGPEGQETYKFLPYPASIAESAADLDYTAGFEWRLVTAGNPPDSPAWAERQYLPQVLEGAAQGDLLYYDGTQEQWVLLPAPTAGELSSFYGDPVLHHDGTAPYWGQDDYYL